MFDIGWSEMMFMVVLAIVVVGPKELPTLMRTVGRWVAKAKQMSREFQHNLEIVADEAQLKDIQKELSADIKAVKSMGAEVAETKPASEKSAETVTDTSPDTSSDTPMTDKQ